MKRIFKRKSKDENKKAIKFIAIWADDNGNGTFGTLGKVSRTRSKIIWSILKDLTASNDIEPEKLKECELALINYNELVIPEIIEYKIVCIEKGVWCKW